jgi:photosystem II protein
MAQIQFARGINESVVPEIRLTKSKDGQQGTAIFNFSQPDILGVDQTEAITGMYLIDEEGELKTERVQAKFINGKPTSLEAVYFMKSPQEWDRFMRFMERYAADNGLGFSKSGK